jgi:Glycosyl-hydrolase 97 C-terminal, oligomerisation
LSSRRRSSALVAIRRTTLKILRAMLTVIAPVWDDTLVLAGSESGKVVTEARRSGKQWFIAVINGGDATTLDIPLNFLGAGSWEAIQLHGAKDKPDAWDRQQEKQHGATISDPKLLPATASSAG